MRGLRHLLCLVVLLQSALAGAHCLRVLAPAPSLAIEICTAEGLRTLHLPDGDSDGRPKTPDHGWLCVACHALPQAILPTPPALPMPGRAATRIDWPPAVAGLPPPGRGPPYRTRAPPAGLS